MRRATHLCPVNGCGQLREWWQEVCRRCFDRLPGDIKGQFARAREARDRGLLVKAGIAARDWLNARPIAGTMDARTSPRDAMEAGE